MADMIVIALVVLVVGLSARYIRREKKRGVKCIGCPGGGNCAACGMHCGEE